MKKLKWRKPAAFLAAITSATLVISLLIAPTARASDFQVEMVSPTTGSSLNSSELFEIKFRFTGGLSTSANSCDSPSLQSFRLGVNLINDENLGRALAWRSTQGGTVSTGGGLTGVWKAKILPNGIECSIVVNNRDFTVWNYAASIDSNWFGTKRIQTDNLANFQRLGVAWIIAPNVSISDRPQANQSLQMRTFQITSEGDLKISVIGLSRGETIDRYKSFKVVASLNSSIEVEQLYAWMPQGSTGDRKRGELNCPQETLVKKTSGSVTEYTVQCHLYLWLGINANTKTLDIRGVLKKENQDYYESYESQPITVNVGKLGIPGFVIQSVRYVSDSPKNKWNPPATLTINGRARFYNSPYSPSTGQDRAVVELCVQSKCRKEITDFSGEFSISMPANSKSVKWSVRVFYEELPVFNKFTFSNESLVDNLDAKEASGEERLPSKPKKPATTSLRANMSAPSSVKWGNSIPLSVSLSGAGSADCRLMFAYPTSGYSYQPLDSGGIRPFVVKGGQTIRVNAYFSKNFKVRWYVVLSCVDRKTGASLGAVERFITNI